MCNYRRKEECGNKTESYHETKYYIRMSQRTIAMGMERIHLEDYHKIREKIDMLSLKRDLVLRST
jgi:hypothetical protein